ncbi:MAG: glycosyltransferase family 2 protein [Armatimonadota bacterium]
MKSGSVCILLLNWNNWKDTVECLESILRSDYSDYRVIVCDNGSEDGSIDRIKTWADGRIEPPVADERRKDCSSPPVAKPVGFVEYSRSEAESGGDPSDSDAKLIIIRNGGNLGFSAGNNVGIRYAISRGADFIWLLNNDTVVADSKIIEKLIENCGEKSICSTVTVDYYSDAIWYSGGKIPWSVAGPVHWHNRRDAGVYDTEFISGCNLFSKAKVFADIGLLDERFFVGMEDCVLCWKAKRSGYRLQVLNIDAVRHKIGKTNRFSRFAIVNSYLCKSFWVRETTPNIFMRFIWLMWFVFANLLVRHTTRFLAEKIRGVKSDFGLMEFWQLAVKALLRGFRVKAVSLSEIRSILDRK